MPIPPPGDKQMMGESKSIGQQSPQITELLSKTASTKATLSCEDTIEEVMHEVSLTESMEVRDQIQPLQIQPESQAEQQSEQYNLVPPVQEIRKSSWVLNEPKEIDEPQP